eukprot:14619659-Heterocapsa_arctica.AAC.1
MLEGFLARDYKAGLDLKVAQKRTDVGQQISFETFRRVIRRCLIHWQAGALLTNSKLAAWWYDMGVASARSKSALLCDLCKQQADTVEHRLLHCEEVEDIRQELMPKGL